MALTEHMRMDFQFTHHIRLNYKTETGFYMRFTFDLLDLDKKKRDLLAKDYVRDWMEDVLEGYLQTVLKKMEDES